MALKVDKVDVWAGSIDDQPGGLAGVLSALSDAGANLEFVIARRSPDKPGTGVVFLAPLKGAKQLAAAKKLKLKKATSMGSVRVEAPDKPGIGAQITAALAEGGINLRGFSAASIGKRCVAYFAFDGAAVSGKARRILKGI